MTSTLPSPSAGQERDLIDVARRCGAFVMKGLNREVAQLSMTPEVLAAFAAALTSASKQEGGEPVKCRAALLPSGWVCDGRQCDNCTRNAAPQPPLAGAGEANMFWNDADPERSADSIHEVIEREWSDGLLQIGDVIEIQRAARLSNIRVELVPDPKDEDGFDYEIMPQSVTPPSLLRSMGVAGMGRASMAKQPKLPEPATCEDCLTVVAWLTTDEEGSPAMLFFDRQEAGDYCELGEEPAALVRLSDAQRLAAEVERLRAEVAALTADAGRYRWLRDLSEWEPFDTSWLCQQDIYGQFAADMDAALDASRLALKEAP